MIESKSDLTISPEDWDRIPDSVRRVIINILGELKQYHSVISENAQSVVESSTLLNQTANIARRRARTRKQVVFVSDLPVTRQAKLAYALRCQGWDTILLHKDKPWFDWSSFFSAAYNYTSSFEAVQLACNFSPVAYHCYSSWNFSTTMAMLKYHPGKIVFDNYDYFAGCLKPHMLEAVKASLPLERYCIESADAICCRGLTLQISRKNMGYKPPKKILFFPEYCWNHQSDYLLPKRTDGIHAVYVGGMEPQYYRDPTKYYSVVDDQFIADITNRKIHYHIYPFTADTDEGFRESHRDYLEEADRNPYFHFHKPVLADQLIREISQYHFGLVSMSHEVTKSGDWSYLPDNHARVTFNKVFDYIDAGLIPVSFGWKTMENLIRGAYVAAERSEVGSILEREGASILNSEIPNRLSAKRQDFALSVQGQRLAKFYDSL